VDVADDADDLARRLVKLRADAFADDDLLADGSSLGQYFLAMASLMRTTPGAPALSLSLKSRPRRMGILKSSGSRRSAHPSCFRRSWDFRRAGGRRS
jgi:hypothetical protein